MKIIDPLKRCIRRKYYFIFAAIIVLIFFILQQELTPKIKQVSTHFSKQHSLKVNRQAISPTSKQRNALFTPRAKHHGVTISSEKGSMKAVMQDLANASEQQPANSKLDISETSHTIKQLDTAVPAKQLNESTERMTPLVVNEMPIWLVNKVTGCNDHFTGFGNEFAWLRFARVNKTNRVFSIPCEEPRPVYNFLFNGGGGTPLDGWLKDLKQYPLNSISQNKTITKLQSSLTVVVMRIEAHNLYHTLCEWYNIFVLSLLFKFDPKQANILFMDDRPPGHMDATWDALFGNVQKYTDLEDGIVFKDLIWSVVGYNSPVQSHSANTIPYVSDFSRFFINSFGVEQTKSSLNCSNINVTLIWRRDYMTHPEREQLFNGLVHRKFENEEEIMNVVKEVFPGHNVRAIILESMSMKEQVNVITNTDVLIGMHGAGMSHVMFLPPHAGVFETFPTYWGYQRHFGAMARWRNIKYLSWQNNDPNNEFPKFYTHIPREVMRSHAEQLKHHICPV